MTKGIKCWADGLVNATTAVEIPTALKTAVEIRQQTNRLGRVKGDATERHSTHLTNKQEAHHQVGLGETRAA